MMFHSNPRRAMIFPLAAFSFSMVALADNHGADPALTGAPGDQTCMSCHTGTALNAGSGSVRIVLPGDKTYTPGVTQRVKIAIADASQKRWGYELTARLASDPSTKQAGDLAIVDSNSQVMCSNGRAKPCASAETIQYITHTLAGSRNGTTAGVEFEFDWTPPSTDVGRITLYAAANAANGDNRNSGDHIYSTSIDLDPAQAAPVKPAINSELGIVNTASRQPGVTSSSWITITGSNFASTTRTWTPADFIDGVPPTSLDGVSVTVNGKAAYIQSISPTKLVVLAAPDESVGPVEVRVTVDGKTSDPTNIELLARSPAFFVTDDAKHVLITDSETSLIEEPGLMPTKKSEKTTVKPGESFLVYGTGFTATDGDVPLDLLTITIGGAPAEVTAAKMVPNAVQLYQFVVKVPDGLSDGDQPIVAEFLSAKTQSTADCCSVTVQQ